MMKLIILLFAVLLGTNNVFAVEIRNIETGQNNKILFVKYDLVNLPGESSAEVLLDVELDGSLYNFRKLAIKGDVGSAIPVGKTKMISWNILKDMPSGYEGEITWHIDVKSNAKSDDPFNIYPKKVTPIKATAKTLLDKTSNIMWVRNIEFGTPSNFNEAEALIENMNANKYAGYSDWKIPSKEDWNKLIKCISAKYGYQTGTSMADELTKLGFNGIVNGYYWASDILEREYIEVDYDVRKNKAKTSVDADSNIKRYNSSTRSYNSNTYAVNSTRQAVSSNIQSGSASATVQRYTSKTRTDMTDKDNAVINLSDGYIYKKQLTTDKSFLLPIRIDTSKRTIKSVVQISP